MATRQTARDYALHAGCLLTSIAVNLAVNRGVHLVSDLVPALALNLDFSGYLLITIATELTAEFSWFFAATFLPRIKKYLSLKRHSLVDFLQVLIFKLHPYLQTADTRPFW
ncbi:MAG: hypothetical protein WBZ42_08445 [Halobacteriota archaeon]